ncbi:NUDIX domain-containing protein [Saccharothrix texasensis]|uniref:NUDIX domain-containing protein n=1 Tax=Saccharothrix texasensis TaxID=103734 RepID=UPI001B8653E8|nr:NUDIX domain-containing protein [Saccharothrix texasensis]
MSTSDERARRTGPVAAGGAEWVDYTDADDRLVARGPREGSGAQRWYRRYAATILTGPGERVLVYLRPAHARVYPGHYDVLVGGGVRAGETYHQAAVRELGEELGIRREPREVLRLRRTAPPELSHLAVHLTDIADLLPPATPRPRLRPDPAEVQCYDVLPVAQVLASPPRPFLHTGLDVLRHLFA